jgi:hypothetical protein
MTKSRKKKTSVPHINASVWLRDEENFTLVENLDHTPHSGSKFVIDGELWRVVEWTDRIECELVAHQGQRA